MVSTGTSSQVPIAIVGLACRFPGEAVSPFKFWDLLKEGRDAYTPKTDRWNADAFYHPNKDRVNTLPTKGGHFLKQDPYVFDAAFFNITAMEAIAMDPKQRIAMEVAYEALENAGLPLHQVAGTQTACFMGSAMTDYRDAVSRDFGNAPKYHVLGTCEEMVSNRISHFLDIHGPSATIHTACSSSLVATHLACQSLRSGESDMAIAGGVGIMLTPDASMQLNNLSFLNPEGHSRSFDADAGGYARGEGCGILVMKRLDQAVRDGDNIRAVIRASGVNSDGWTQGVTMPSAEAQAALVKYVFESNGLDYGTIQYVEAHGTGTKAGDPVETSAIYKTIGQGASKSRKLWIGSVKPNIGHLEAAAGVAGIIKGVLALEHNSIPPNIYFNKPNPAIKFDEWNMAVPTKMTPWPVAQTKRMTVSGFGMGGTNGLVVLEQYNPSRPAPALLENGRSKTEVARAKKRLFVCSSQDQAGLKRWGDKLVDHLDSLGPAASTPEYLADLAHTLSVARSGLSWKASFQADSAAELRDQLATNPGENASRASEQQPPRIGFVFTGQGAQWAGMGIDLLERPIFRSSVAKSAELLQDMGCDWDPVAELKMPQSESHLGIPEISQPICTVLQIALVDELKAWGVTPSKVVGHSSGEIAAAYSIGALTHRDAIAVAYYRGKASAGLKETAPQVKGGMMAVGASADEAQKLISENKLKITGSDITVACVNSPSSVTLSGDAEALEQLRAILEERKVFARRLKVEVAYHSSHMSFAVPKYLSSIADIDPRQPSNHDVASRQVMVSSVTAQEAAPELLGTYYWVRNLVSPVLFSDALAELVSPAGTNDVDIDLLIEVGPHSALGGPVEQILSHHGIQNVGYKSVLTRSQNGLDTTLNLASELFLLGVSLNMQNVNGDSDCRLLLDLPPYPWNHSKVFRADGRWQRELISRKAPGRSLIGSQLPMLDENQHVWRNHIRLADEPWLRGHIVGGMALVPGAGMVSMILEAAQELVDAGKTARMLRLRDVSFFAAFTLPEDTAIEVITTIRPHLVGTSGSTPASWFEFTISSCAGADQLRDNCRGLVAIEYAENRSPQMVHEDDSAATARIADYHRVREECSTLCTKEAFYDHMTKSGYGYGGQFNGMEKIQPGDGQTVFDVKLSDIGETFSKGQLERPFLVHGATLDSIFQSIFGSAFKDGAFEVTRPNFLTYIGELDISLDFPAPTDAGYVMPGLCKSRKHGFNQLSAEMFTFDESLSKMYLLVGDFRMAEAEADVGTEKGPDAAAFTSVPRWDHALSLMRPEEVSRVLATLPPETAPVELIRMILHDNPSASVVELVSNQEGLSNAAASKLPRGSIQPSQLRYAMVDSSSGAAVSDENLVGETFELGGMDAVLPAEKISSSDLLIIPQSADGLKDRYMVLERFVKLAKPEALVITAAGKTLAASFLETKGFTPLPILEGTTKFPQLHSNTGKKSLGLTNGASDTANTEMVILEPSVSTASTEAFTTALRSALQGENYSVSVQKWSGADQFDGKTYISLLELEQPILDNLSEPDFQRIRSMVLQCGRLLWITCGDNPSFSCVDGFSRVMRSELGSAKFQVLHLSAETGLQSGASLASRILESASEDSEFRERGGLPQVLRIFNSLEGNDSIREHLENSTRVMPLKQLNHPVRLTIDRPGLLDTLQFVKAHHSLTPLADTEIELQVKATGINFRDVMASMGLVSTGILGFEASGVVIQSGSKATQFKPGDRVSVVGEHTHGTSIRVDSRLVAPIPDGMSFEEAAALPIVGTTAYHTLVNLARLRKGQSVLIHAAAGGVGQAAIQLATHLGLVVYATVGTEDKRQLLVEKYKTPEEHIFNSRDTSFVKGIKRATGGRGVDCVLNSLSGELLRASWGCLATFGTFIELGLRDITNNMRLDMRPFSKVTTFTFCNILAVMQEDPDFMGEILKQTFQLIDQKVLFAPSPTTVYPVRQLHEAFRTIQQGKHRGKLVLSFSEDAQAPVLCEAKESLRLDPNATYLIVGGLGGLGRSVAREFVASGARNLAFVSRSGDATPAAKAVTDELAARNVRVHAYRADVADEGSFLEAMDQCSRDLPPIKGIIQMAMVLHDVVFEKMSYEQWTVPIRPKVQGTWNIHKYFDHSRPLDFMVICSSTSGIHGYPSQAQYAAGNTYQDALAYYRRERGLKAVSVNLTIIREVGILAEQGTTGNIAIWEEALGIKEPAFHALMKSLINGQRGPVESLPMPPQISTGLGTADIMAAHGLALPDYFSNPMFGPLAVSAVSSGTVADGQKAAVSLASRLVEAGGIEEATEIIADALVTKLAHILQMPSSEVDPSRPMYRYGVDSLVALEVRNWITREMKANIALLEILAAVPINGFARTIAERSKHLSAS